MNLHYCHLLHHLLQQQRHSKTTLTNTIMATTSATSIANITTSPYRSHTQSTFVPESVYANSDVHSVWRVQEQS